MKKLLAFFLVSLRLWAQSESPTEILIPGGSFDMGDFLDGSADARPVPSVRVASFWMERDPVTHELWRTVHAWAVAKGYSFSNAGKGKAPKHPVHSVSWHDAVRWCNARSEREGRTPVYYVDAALGQVFRSGEPEVFANWAANGYRLPSEAEWEKAARGNQTRKRFPRGNTLGILDANFYAGATGTNVPAYMGGLTGYNPVYALDGMPYTSPVDAFPPNDLGLRDMSGNVFQWCWDWYDSAYRSADNPRGAKSGNLKVIRGGSWYGQSYYCRVGYRNSMNPRFALNTCGFRCATSAAAPKPPSIAIAVSQDQIAVSFDAVIGTQYSIQQATNPDGPWTEAATLAGQNGPLVWKDLIRAQAIRFLRVVAQ
jgi:formylglycine-generating enzyme required for sulfatase activity